MRLYYVSPQEEKPDSQKVIVGVEGWDSTVLCQPTGGKARLIGGIVGGGGQVGGGALQFCVSPQEEKPDSQKVLWGGGR